MKLIKETSHRKFNETCIIIIYIYITHLQDFKNRGKFYETINLPPTTHEWGDNGHGPRKKDILHRLFLLIEQQTEAAKNYYYLICGSDLWQLSSKRRA